MMEPIKKPDNVRFSDDGMSVVILDQSLLPNETKYLTLSDREELFEAIAQLRVRGAPAIGIFAAFAVSVLATRSKAADDASFYQEFTENKAYLESSRPTAVNLRHALDRMDAVVHKNAGLPIPALCNALYHEALAIQNEDIAMCRAIAEHGLSLVKDGDGVLTHCNAGPLATSLYGTGLGAIFLAHERGLRLRVFVDETRPLLQGARLTSYELHRAGIGCTLICDNMASLVMKEGKIGAVFVGCDRVARNGDTANKIGTNGLAVLARYYSIPFFVFCPSSTIDFNCKTGADIVIEQRPSEEIKEKFFEKPMALPEIACYNPAFDVTDASLITAIITENGVCRPPYRENLANMFQNPPAAQ
ncbi:S-methyl-5-thioribose-1-phosphate isomerase [Oscillospiraceae bacterium CM]|nr:S-methyl-5-thioribose-1-phosphate isomerase [Oscillospiraceae bacterium CM]